MTLFKVKKLIAEYRKLEDSLSKVDKNTDEYKLKNEYLNGMIHALEVIE